MSEEKPKRKRRGRRGNHEGTIYQRADGRWEARLQLPNGERLSYYGKTRVEAQEKLEMEKRELGIGVDLSARRQTVEEFLRYWLDHSAKARVAPKTFRFYHDIVHHHLIPELGSVRLSRLSVQDVGLMLKRKQASDLSPRTVGHIRSVFRTALNQAMRWSIVTRNVAGLTDAVRQNPPKIEAFTIDEARTILAAAKGHRLEALFVVSMSLGLRKGEVLGLRWKDVDLEAGELRVEGTLQRIDGELVLRPTKTDKSRRRIRMPAFIQIALASHRDRQECDRRRPGWVETGFVFTSTRGTPIDERNLSREWHALLESAGMPARRFHDTRHTAVSTMAAMGVPLKVIQEILGHSMLSTTADIYAHLAPVAFNEAASAIDQAFGAKPTRQKRIVVKPSSRARTRRRGGEQT